MLYFIDQIVQEQFSFSLLETECYEFVSRKQLGERAKRLRPLPKEQVSDNIVLSGKKRFKETGEFYTNARALATIALEYRQEHDGVCAVLFQDADSVEQREWQRKWDSAITGFNAAKFTRGIPMIPKPVSEAWILCTIYSKENPHLSYNHLENTKHGNQSDHALKIELEKKLGEQPTRELLNDKIKSNEMDVGYINLDSFNAFKTRLTEVL